MAYTALQRIPQWIFIRRLAVAGITLLAASCAAPAGVEETERSLEAADVPNVDQSLLTLADQMAAEGRYAAAMPLYRRAHQRDGGALAPAVGLGNALLKVGRNSEARDIFQKTLTEHPESVDAATGLGRAWLALGRSSEALEAFDRALEIDPGDGDALNGKGVALAAMGRHEAAIDTFEDGLDRHPDHLSLQNNLGLALSLSGDPEAGIEMLESVVQDPRARAKNRQSLAMAYGMAGQTDEARQMGAIDLSLIDVEEEIAGYRTLAAMPPERRGTVMLDTIAEPKRDLARPAFQSFPEPEAAGETVDRLLGEETAEVANIAPVSIPGRQTRELAEEPVSIPPLDNRQGYAVQIAAYRHASELMPGWRELKAKYGDLLEGLDPRRSEVDFGDREDPPRGFFYRLNAGPLQTFKEAKAICDAITAKGGECWVRPPLPEEGDVPVAAQDTPGPQESLEADSEPNADSAEGPESAPTDQAAAAADGSGEKDVWVALDTPQESADDSAAEAESGETVEPAAEAGAEEAPAAPTPRSAEINVE